MQRSEDPSHRRRTLSNLVKILIPIGFLATIGAIILTLYALSNSLGSESNPYFAELGAETFTIGSSVYILFFYLVVLFSPTKLVLKLMAVVPATTFHFFDFLHDLTFVGNRTVSTAIPIFLFATQSGAAEFLIAGSIVGVYSFVMLIVVIVSFKENSLKERK